MTQVRMGFIGAGGRVSECMDGVAIADHLPVDARITHFILKRGDFLWWHIWIVGSVQRENFCFNVFCIIGSGT